MTKEDIKKAIRAYKGKYPYEYGWMCYGITYKDGNRVVYFLYEKMRNIIMYKMWEEGDYIIASPLYGGNSKKYKINDCSAIAILCLLQWMRGQISRPMRLKRQKN